MTQLDRWQVAPVGLCELDADGRITMANERFVALTAQTAEGIIGRSWSTMLAASSRLYYETQLVPILALGDRAREVMIEVRTADGRSLPALLNAEPMRPPDGPGVRLALLAVPDRQRYESSLRRRYAREHSDSLALQHALITQPPEVPGIQIIARYLPARQRAEVGGDWHDAYLLPDGALGAVIGDVAGHDIHAAARMGQLRGVLRALDYGVPGSPADTLRRTDQVGAGLGLTGIATAILAHIDASSLDSPAGSSLDSPGASAQLVWSNAGHPPPILVDSTGQTTILERRADLMLGVIPTSPRHDHRIEVRRGDSLLLYTDGLIERPGRHIDEGLGALCGQLAGSHALTLQELCDRALQSGARYHDDIALLAIRIGGPAGAQSAAAGAPVTRS